MAQGDEGEAVVDTSVLGRILLREEGWKETLTRLSTLYIHVVDFQISEMGNLLWKRKDLTLEEALERYREGMILVDEVHRVEVVFPEALRIAKEATIPFYDAAVIALAKHLSLPLFTSDREQGRVSKGIGVRTELLV